MKFMPIIFWSITEVLQHDFCSRGLMRNEHGRFDATAISPNSVFNGGSDLYFGNQRISTATWWNWPKLITQFTDGVVLKRFSITIIINVSNMIINRAENDPNDWEGGSAEKDEINKTSIIAQAKFFRAWAYRHLTYSFGDVPLSLEEITDQITEQTGTETLLKST